MLHYYIELLTSNDTTQKLQVVINITEIPNNAWWGFFRVKIGTKINDVISEDSWSEASYWIGVINIAPKLNRPVSY